MTKDRYTALFDSARQAPLETSTADVDKWIATAALGLGFTATLKVFIIKNWVIMTSILASLTGVVVIVTMTMNTPSKMKNEKVDEKNQFLTGQKTIIPVEKVLAGSIAHPEETVIEAENVEEPLFYLSPMYLKDSSVPTLRPVQSVKQIVPQTTDNQSFSRIETSGFASFTLMQGSACSVTTSLDSSEVSFDIEDGKLEITGMNEHDPNAIIITVVELEKIELTGFSKMIMNSSLNSKDLEIDVNGFSSCQLIGDVSLFDAEISGESTIIFSGKCTKMDLEISGMSKLDLTIESADLELELSGQSSAKITGAIVNVEADISGMSDLKAKDCYVESMAIDVTGESDAVIQVKNTLDAEVSGKSKLKYYGNPTKIKEDASGLSVIKAMK
ncbi:MAG: DUF2807 domain-containing protein [Crocinitomicaceae bacterium]|nr:DUF2807 domain-containing protein [Crocinitomicaceae bacterium]MBP6032527.1 DUF2807 domain-containing protein [Crocinitomicaceae bacterium]